MLVAALFYRNDEYIRVFQVRDIARDCLSERAVEEYRWQPSAIACLQEVSKKITVIDILTS